MQNLFKPMQEEVAGNNSLPSKSNGESTDTDYPQKIRYQ